MSGYIGTQPVPQATQTRDIFTATAGQTSFATGGYTPQFLDVYLNGVHLQNGTDYTASNGSDVVLTTSAAADDVLEVVAYTTFELVSPTFSGTVTADGLTVDTDTLHVDSTNNRVGIGTSSPDANLEVENTAGAASLNVRGSTDTIVRARQTGNTGFGYFSFGRSEDIYVGGMVYDHNNDNMRFNVNNAERMRIDSGGNVGIGTSSPDSLLTVDGQTIIGDGVAGSPNLTSLTSGTPPQLIAGWSVPAISWTPSSSTEAVFTRDGSMQVDILAGANQFSNLNFSDPDDEDIGQISYDHSTDAMRLRTNNTERMRIDSSGNLLVGTTSGSDRVTVNGTVSATSFSGDGSALTGIDAGPSTSYGAVGTYAAFSCTQDNIGIGSTTSGSKLRKKNDEGDGFGPIAGTYGTSTASGTWRVMGNHRTLVTSEYGNYTYHANLFVRIS